MTVQPFTSPTPPYRTDLSAARGLARTDVPVHPDVPLHPDAPLPVGPGAPQRTFGDALPQDVSAFARALDAAGATLQRADSAEQSFAEGGGSLQDAIYERARADVALNVAVAGAQRAVSALQSILNMPV